jgi:hypothetical protein
MCRRKVSKSEEKKMQGIAPLQRKLKFCVYFWWWHWWWRVVTVMVAAMGGR